MSIPQASSSGHGGPLQRRQQSPVTVFLVGFPLAGLVLGLSHLGPLKDSPYRRYFIHPVECVEVVLFCCALTALGGKLWHYGREQKACRTKLLPAWDGQSSPAKQLLAGATPRDRLRVRLAGDCPYRTAGRRYSATGRPASPPIAA